MSRPRVLVTGGAGFLGTRVVAGLAAGEAAVLDPAGGPGTVAGDLRDDLAAIRLPEGIEHIVHLAQSPRHREFPQRTADLFGVNVGGAWKVAELGRRLGVKSLVIASSGSVYARSEEPLVESSPLVREGDFYAHSKLAAELVVSPYRELFPVHILRFFFIYGPRQPEGMLIPRLHHKISNNEPVSLHGEDGFSFNPVFVEDAAAVVLEVMTRPESVTLNVAGPEVVSLRSLCAELGDIAKRTPAFQTRATDPVCWIADTSALQRQVGPCPTGITVGLAQTFS